MNETEEEDKVLIPSMFNRPIPFSERSEVLEWVPFLQAFGVLGSGELGGETELEVEDMVSGEAVAVSD